MMTVPKTRPPTAIEPGDGKPDSLVARNQLNDRFFENLNRKLTLVEAPAGYGKTTLMQGWYSNLTQAGHTAIWVQIGADAIQALSLEEQILLALARDGKYANDQQTLKTDPLNVETTATLSSVMGLLGSLQNDVFLFFDDVHESTSAEADFIYKLMLQSDDRFHVVIGTRETLGFPLTKLRLEQRVTDFGIDDMRLDRSEVSRFLGTAVPDTTVNAFYEYTEGWVAALQLLRQSNTLSQPFEIGFRKDHGGQAAIAEYLNEHFFQQLSSDQQSFLVDTAHLGTIDGDLADHIRQKSDGWELLAGLSKAHSLVFEVSGMMPGYRYHQLLRDFLHKRQMALGELRVRELNLRTAEWSFQNDRLTSAVRHALAAKAPDSAVEMILEAGAVQIGMQQGAPRLAACLDQIPMQLVHQTPRLTIARAYLLLKNARLDEASLYLEEVQRAIDSNDEEARRELVMVEAHKRLYEDRHLTKDQLAALEHTARITPVSDELMRGLFANFLCHFQIQAGNLDKAREYGDAAMAIYSDLKLAHLQFFMHLHLSVIDLDRGDYTAALSRRQMAQDLVEKQFRNDSAMGALAEIYFCEIAFESGQLEGLETRLGSALGLASKAEGWSEAYLAGYETCLKVSFETQGFDTAIEHIAEAEATATRRSSRRFARHMRILELELMLDAEKDAEAGRLVAQIESMLDVREQKNKLRWRGRVLARLALARAHARTGKTDKALALLSDVEQECRQIGLERYLLRCEALRVIVAVQAENWVLADQFLKSVLQLANEGFPGALLRHADVFSRAVRDCIHHNGLAAYSQVETRKLAGLLWACSRRDPNQTQNLLTEILTDREYAVISLIARGAANKVIARELDLSEATVKFHLKNIFAKLGVNSRKLAAEIALAHGLEIASPADGA